MIFLFPGFGTPLITTIIVLFTLAYIWLLVKWLINPQKFKEQQIKSDQNMQNSAAGRVLSTSINSWTVDIQIFKFIFYKFSLVIPFLISIALIFAVIYLPLIYGFDGQVLKAFYQARVSPVWCFPLLFIIHSFICCSIYIFEYLVLGHILRKKVLNISEGISVLFARYFKLFGFVILLSFVWVLSILTFGGNKRRSTSSQVISGALGGIFSVFKLFIYSNIVRVSLGDEKSSFKETYEFVKKDAYQMLRVWFGSGLLVSSVFILFIVAIVILGKAGILPATEGVQNVVAPAFFIGLIFILAFRAFAEQIGVFSVYLKDRYNVDMID